jgi:hypothetical protein
MIKEFFLGVLASLAAGVLLLFLGRVSQRWRTALTKLCTKLARIDLEYVFQNKADAEADLRQRVATAGDVAVFTGRGNELQRAVFASIFLHRDPSRIVRVRVLLPSTRLAAGDYDWTAQREAEVAAFDTSFGNGLLHRQIDTNVAFLQPYVKEGKIELRRFSAPHMGRIVSVDATVYYTPYTSDKHGRDCPVYRFAPGGCLSRNMQRLFEQLWSVSEVDQEQ